MDTIIFDVDDTLYDQALSFKKTFNKIINLPFSDEEIQKFYRVSRKHSDALFDKHVAGGLTLKDVQIGRITHACEEFGIAITDQQASEFQDAYVEEQQKITLFTEVENLLNELDSQNKRLAILTNGEEKHQAMKIKQLNLGRWIPEANTFISGSIGHAKPKREVFDFVVKRLNLDKSKTVYIGDTFENDIVGAKNAGWHAIWMNHRNRSMPTNSVQPDKTVYSAKELAEVVLNDFSPVK